jgi:hypothetical protein
MYAQLQNSTKKMEARYVQILISSTRGWQLEDEGTLLCDKEKLSIAFSTPPDGVVYIWKNQGLSDDCHTVTKSVSKLHGWEKISSASCHFHHFRDRDTVFW